MFHCGKTTAANHGLNHHRLILLNYSLSQGSTSVVVDMIFEPSLPGVPVLYVIDGGDFQNLAYPVEGMVVSSADVSGVSSGDSTLAYTLIGGVAIITVGIGIAIAMRAGRKGR